MPAKLHLAENTFALHLLFQRLEGLIDIIIADENLHACSSRVSQTSDGQDRDGHEWDGQDRDDQDCHGAGARPAATARVCTLNRGV
jgi:hypothetical protein